MEKQVMGLATALVAIIVLIIGSTYFFGQTPALLKTVDTGVGGNLENLTSDAKQVAGVIPIFWILGGMVLVVGGAFGLYKYFSKG